MGEPSEEIMAIYVYPIGFKSIVGNAYVWYRDRKTGRTKIQKIPLSVFQSRAYEIAIQAEIRTFVQDLVQEFQVLPSDVFIFKPGAYFNLAKLYLEELGYQHREEEFTGQLGQQAIQRYNEYLHAKLDVPAHIKYTPKTLEKSMKQFEEWIGQDYRTRGKYVKTGMELWQKEWKAPMRQKWHQEKKKRGSSPKARRRRRRPSRKRSAGKKRPAAKRRSRRTTQNEKPKAPRKTPQKEKSKKKEKEDPFYKDYSEFNPYRRFS